MDSWRLVVLAVLLVLSAYFSGSETALFSLKPLQVSRLRQVGGRATRAILSLLEKPRSLLATVLVGNTVVNVVISVLAAGLFVKWFGPERGSWLATLVMTVVILVFGEIVPKTIAVSAPVGVSRAVASTLLAAQRLLRPVANSAAIVTDAVSRALERRVPPRDEALTEQEIKTLITIGSEHGVVGLREKQFIHNVFHLDDRLVRNIVTPRARVFTLDADARVEHVRDAVALAGYTRIPVYSQSPENITGYVQMSDLLWEHDIADPRRVRDLERPLHFYPDSKRAGELLSEMHRNSLEIAGVVDEHGAFDGVVSLEDAVEQVVGEIFDMRDLDRFRFSSTLDGEVLVAAQMELEVFNRLLNVELHDREAETIGGFLINRLGRIPQVGEQLQVGDIVLQVEQALPQRVVKLRVQRASESRREP